MGTPVPRITVSVVSHGQRDLVAPLLADLARLCPGRLQLILTLNIPEPDPVLPPSDALVPQIIRNRVLAGFGANHNAAARLAEGAFFCVLNPDVRLAEDPFPALMAALQPADAGVVAPRVLDSRGLEQNSARRFPTLGSLLVKAFTRTLAPEYPSAGTGPGQPDWVAGMFMLFRTEVYRAIGGFDERYFLYYEDVDLCLRLRRAGRRVLYLPEVSIIHDSQRASWRKPRYALHHARSMLRYLMRWHFGV
jgi:GT2 family glycosyltransferase